MPNANAASVPGRICSHMSERDAIQVSCGSMVMSFVPRFIDSTIQWPVKASELFTTGFTPHSTQTSGFTNSGSSS
jgi:hypothetical protein